MTKRDIWMPLYVADYLKDTSRLTTTEHGAYLLLIMDYWINGPLPNDDKKLAEIAKISKFLWKKLRNNLLNFFEISDKFLHHKRIDEEIRKQSQAIEKYRKIRIQDDPEQKQKTEVLDGKKHGENGDKSKSNINTKTLKSKTKSKTVEHKEITLPPWLKKDTWDAWVEHRQELKKPLTENSANLCIARLKKLFDMGFTPESVIEQSIIGRYTGLFPSKIDSTKNYKSFSDQNRDFADRLTGRNGDKDDIIDIN